jgi:hypothetical protein
MARSGFAVSGGFTRLAGLLKRPDGASRSSAGHDRQVGAGAVPSSTVPGLLAVRPLMAVVIGLEEALLERALAVVGAGADRAAGSVATVCLTDCCDFELFRRHRLWFEYLPPLPQQERFAPDLDWGLYTLRRLARLRRKWNPVRIVAFGPIAQAQVALWRASPFEDETIKELIGAPAPAHD